MDARTNFPTNLGFQNSVKALHIIVKAFHIIVKPQILTNFCADIYRKEELYILEISNLRSYTLLKFEKIITPYGVIK